ncbi:MAG TPA: serine--tRNA ligase [Frankiaceae bacterium]|nr:serine--tRNA ligase [Frankiaceae bacterium]
MIDVRILREDPQRGRDSQLARGEDPRAVDRLLEADAQRRAAVTKADTLRAEANAASKAISTASKDDRHTLIEQAKQGKQLVAAAEAAQSAAEEALDEAQRAIPNLIEGAPPGGEADFVVLREVGEKPALENPLDHLELGERLAAIDVERGAKVSGSRFYFLTGVGALLELALQSLAVAQGLTAGFTPMITPALVLPAAMEGTGFLGAHAAEVYQVDDQYLVGTSEVPLAAYHSGEILDASSLPRRYLGISPCFRREAGSYGKDTRGIIRVHQFDKVEMFSLVETGDALAEHERLLAEEEQMLSALELPYRVIDVAAGDLGSSAARKFDCEAWLPSQGRWLELTSTSNCTTFQARRLGIRSRSGEGTVGPLATLNGTLVAMARTIVAILENHQQPDGSVRVPAALVPYLGREVLTPQ